MTNAETNYGCIVRFHIIKLLIRYAKYINPIFYNIVEELVVGDGN